MPASITRVEKESDVSSGQIQLPAGTELWLMAAESISSERAKPGDHIKLQAVGGVRVGDLTVVANRAAALATVAEVKKTGRAWRPGYLAISLESVTSVSGERIPLERSPKAELGRNAELKKEDLGQDPVSFGLSVSYLLLFSWLEHGEEAILPRGVVMLVTTRDSVVLDIASLRTSQPNIPRKAGTSASLTIYYPEFAPDGSVAVWCGTVKVGKLYRGRKLTLELPPGVYWLRSKKEKDAGVSVQAESGGDYYVEILAPYFPEGVLVDRDLGEARASFTLPADPKDVRDLTNVALRELRVQDR